MHAFGSRSRNNKSSDARSQQVLDQRVSGQRVGTCFRMPDISGVGVGRSTCGKCSGVVACLFLLFVNFVFLEPLLKRCIPNVCGGL
jgi:hypothetical protein